jgi:16S rRNA (adenine1518-N6/adenine1519-N6)-dimethyltransferase
MELSPNCFFPVPRVRSTFVRVRPAPESDLSSQALDALEPLVRAAFSKRRKTVANALRGGPYACADETLAAAGLPPRARAEQLAPQAFVALARQLSLLPPAA